ncbi:MAG: hypothetical protein ABF278_08095 [Wenyingzhuangia sp.]|jgi:hypothetical protein|uniref:hypothetical protein n=1 Tax=Wenyingzhuangia sp. TaxID=1964193 RepID=UPI0032197A98
MNNKDRNVIESLTSVMMDIKKAIELIDQKIDKLNYAIESLNTTEAVVASKVVLDSPKKPNIDYNDWGNVKEEDEPVEEVHKMIKSNKFVDDGSLFQEEEDRTPPVNPSPRKRRGWESNLIEVTCDKCKKTEKVNKIHATGSIYSCRRCSRR